MTCNNNNDKILCITHLIIRNSHIWVFVFLIHTYKKNFDLIVCPNYKYEQDMSKTNQYWQLVCAMKVHFLFHV